MKKRSINLDVTLHAAFFMEGLHEAGYDKVIKACGRNNCGYIEMVRELVLHADTLEAMCSKAAEFVNDDYPGVFDYEVSSPFGRWFGQHIIDTGGDIPTTQDAERELVRLTAEFFAQHHSDLFHQLHEQLSTAFLEQTTTRKPRIK